MSEQTVKLLHRASDAFNRRDLDAFLAVFDPDVDFNSRVMELESGGARRGYDGIREWWDDVFAIFPDFSAEIEEIQDLGDMTITKVRLRGQGAGSDAPTEQTQWIVSEWREEKAIRWHALGTRADALEAAGLAE